MEMQNLNRPSVPELPQKSGASKKWMWIVGVIVILIALYLVAVWQGILPGLGETAGPALSEEDTTAVIEEELSMTDFGDIEAELEALEADLQAL